LTVSIGFESLFIYFGMNGMDEGWPLHAAMEMHDGKTLYDEVFWVFPPGHVLPSWIAYAIKPPGFVVSRFIYAGFDVALCVALFFVARKFMSDDFALLGGLMVAISAPDSHAMQLLFGFRYLVLSVIVLLFFHRRLSLDDSRWMFPAGIFAGIALFFRLTPAFAVSAAVAVGIVAASWDLRRWMQDGLWYSAGLILVWIPVLVWFGQSVGLEKFWIEMVVRPVEMTDLQSRPFPLLAMREMSRAQLTFAFASLGFRLYPIFCAGFVAVLLFGWLRALRARQPFEHVFLLTFALFAGIFFLRSLGRSDVPHLDSAMPPIVILIAYCVSRLGRRLATRSGVDERRAVFEKWALIVCVFAIWSFLHSSDRYLDQEKMLGDLPLKVTSGEIRTWRESYGRILDDMVPVIQAHSDPDDTIFVMTNAPLFYVIAERHSPGYLDFVMPGTFRTAQEELDMLERLKADPPAVVIWPRHHFDQTPARGLGRTAPVLSKWVLKNYRSLGKAPVYAVMVPKADDAGRKPSPDGEQGTGPVTRAD
jgi:hypothetical protein